MPPFATRERQSCRQCLRDAPLSLPAPPGIILTRARRNKDMCRAADTRDGAPDDERVMPMPEAQRSADTQTLFYASPMRRHLPPVCFAPRQFCLPAGVATPPRKQSLTRHDF